MRTRSHALNVYVLATAALSAEKRRLDTIDMNVESRLDPH